MFINFVCVSLWPPKVRPLYFTTDFLKFVSIDERQVMGSQPNLASRLKVVLIYKCPPKTFWPPNLGTKTSNF